MPSPIAAPRLRLAPRAALEVPLIFLASLAALYALSGRPPLHEDTVRDLYMARECTQFGACYLAGPHTSFRGLLNGAVWIHALSAFRFLGASVPAIQAVVLALHALAAAVVYRSARAFTPARAPLAAWAAFIPLSVRSVEAPVLWNPSLLPLPTALFHALFLLAVRTGDAAPAVLAGLMLALGDSHLVSLALLPILLFATLATARRPALATLGALGAFAATEWVVSTETALSHLQRLGPVAPVAAVGLGVIIAAALALRRRALALSADARTAAALGLACAGVVLPLVIGRFATGHPLSWRYFGGVVPPAALALGWLATGTSRDGRPGFPRGGALDLARCGALVLAVALVLPRPEPAPVREGRWGLAEAERLARALYARGESYESLVRRLRGPDAAALVASLGAFEPDRAREAGHTPRGEGDLLVLRVPSRAMLPPRVPQSWTVVPLGGDAVAVLRQAGSWLDASGAEACVRAAGRDPRCATADAGAWADPERGGDELGRAQPTLVAEGALGEPAMLREGGYLRTLVFPVKPQPGAPHAVTTRGARRPWSVAVEGSAGAGAGALRGAVWLDPQGSRRVRFRREVRGGDVGAYDDWVPGYVEFAADEVELQALLQRLWGSR